MTATVTATASYTTPRGTTALRLEADAKDPTYCAFRFGVRRPGFPFCLQAIMAREPSPAGQMP